LLLRLFTLIVMFFPSLGLGAVVDLRADKVPLHALSVPWEYSETPIIPGRLRESAEAHKPQEFWLERSQLSERASFRIKILRTAQQPALLLVLKEMPAVRVLVDGTERVEKGKLYDASGHIQNSRGDVSILLPQAEVIEIILEVAATLPRWSPAAATIEIGPEAEMRAQILRDSIILATMLGGLFIIGLYHIALFILTPTRLVTLTLGALCIVNCIRTAVTGVDTLFNFWPNFPFELAHKMAYIGYYFAPALFIEFLRLSFPGTISKKTVRMLWIFSGTFIAMTLVTPVAVYGRWNTAFHAITFTAIVIAVLAITRAIHSRTKGSGLQALACTLVCSATVNDVLHAEGLPSLGPIISAALFIFILLQSLILSSQFSQAFAELAHTYREFTKIVYLHTVKQIASGFDIERTMPLGTAEAVVLAFDIVGSSRIKHPELSDAVERMMGRCYDAMSEGYCDKNMRSRAYRVKEMGDGLLCSVGFPFPSGKAENNSSVAVSLAEDFMHIFKEEFEKLDLDSDAYCGIGIARGPVEGFFPRFGVKQYDLRGKTIVLATRYESMRNAVFHRMGWKGSVIFLQDDVYAELKDCEKAFYTEWDATKEGQRIRDDAQALKAWYRFVPHAVAKHKRGLNPGEMTPPDQPLARLPRSA